MCGLVGIISKKKNGFSRADVDAFSQLLFIDQFRGRDGTGIFYNVKKGSAKVRTLKAAYRSSLFLDTKEYGDAIDTMLKESNFMIGHNRAATRGKVEVECTHPFRENHITLVHNGTLNFYTNLAQGAVNDSHAICKSIASDGAKETLKKIDGAFALIWFDAQKKALFLCRNSQRPLNIVECEDSFLIASEADMAQYIANRNNLKIKNTTTVKEKTLYRFNIGDMSKWEEEEVEFKTPFVQKSFGTGTKTYDSPYMGGQKLSYKLGDRIRFRPNTIKFTVGGLPFLNSDINKYPNSSLVVIEADFEKRFRVLYFGKQADMQKLLGKTDLEGIVSAITDRDGVEYYTVKDIKEWDIGNKHGAWGSNVKTFTEKKHPEDYMSQQWCEACYTPFRGNTTLIDGLEVCPKCASLAASGGCC